MKNSSNRGKIENKPMSPNQSNNTLKTNNRNSKANEELQPSEKKILKEKNLERFIHVTTYDDYETMKILKDIFEKINREAFNLKSVKEIYTKTLTPTEMENNNLNYISGFQLIDRSIRITIIEGPSKGAIEYVREKLPKLHINNDTKKIFANGKILFDTRIYSKFNLSLKLIKLRDTLENILTTFDIYLKATKYKEIYCAFMNLGFILKSKTLSEIAHADLFPSSENLLLLERKYADILKDEDINGIQNESKGKNNVVQGTNNPDINQTSNMNESKVTNSSERRKLSIKPRLDSFNPDFEKQMESRISEKKDFNMRNFETLQTINLKKKPGKHFCRFDMGKNADNSIKNAKDVNLPQPVYLYSNQKNNYYNLYMRELNNKLTKDINNFYTYSHDYLFLSFPYLEPYSNKKFSDYMDNKKVRHY